MTAKKQPASTTAKTTRKTRKQRELTPEEIRNKADIEQFEDELHAYMTENRGSNQEHASNLDAFISGITMHPLWRLTVVIDASTGGTSKAEERTQAKLLDLELAADRKELQHQRGSSDFKSIEAHCRFALIEMTAAIGQSVRSRRLEEVLPKSAAQV